MEERLRDLSAILKSGRILKRFRDLRSGIQNTDTNLQQMYCYTNKEQTNKVMEIHFISTIIEKSDSTVLLIGNHLKHFKMRIIDILTVYADMQECFQNVAWAEKKSKSDKKES